MNVLVACEESQRVCCAFRSKGHNAFSCDILDCSGGHPEWHIKGDVIPLLNPFDYIDHYGQPQFGFCFTTCDGRLHELYGKWDLIIAHPPCTFLTVAGNCFFNVSKYGESALTRQRLRLLAADFFMFFVNCDCDHICIENPIGFMSSFYRKPDQIVQPYYFGDPYRKSTCLWLKGLPKLYSTNIVDFEILHSKGKSGGYSGHSWVVRDPDSGRILPYNHPLVSRIRSKTYPGIASAMSDQWG